VHRALAAKLDVPPSTHAKREVEQGDGLNAMLVEEEADWMAPPPGGGPHGVQQALATLLQRFGPDAALVRRQRCTHLCRIPPMPCLPMQLARAEPPQQRDVYRLELASIIHYRECVHQYISSRW
jgi:hypothetical protein